MGPSQRSVLLSSKYLETSHPTFRRCHRWPSHPYNFPEFDTESRRYWNEIFGIAKGKMQSPWNTLSRWWKEGVARRNTDNLKGIGYVLVRAKEEVSLGPAFRPKEELAVSLLPPKLYFASLHGSTCCALYPFRKFHLQVKSRGYAFFSALLSVIILRSLVNTDMNPSVIPKRRSLRSCACIKLC